MALDLVSERGFCGEIVGRYRHGAESFAWCPIRLCLATAKSENGKNYTLNPYPLREWFQDCKTSLHFKLGLE